MENPVIKGISYSPYLRYKQATSMIRATGSFDTLMSSVDAYSEIRNSCPIVARRSRFNTTF